MLGIISSDKIVFAIVAGIPAAVVAITLIWIVPRTGTTLRALGSLVVVAAGAAGMWAAFRSPGQTAAGSPQGGGPPPARVTCSPTGPRLQISAKNIRFDTSCLAVRANTPFTVMFSNQDNVTHNFEIFTQNPLTSPGAGRLGGATSASDVVQPGSSTTYDVAGLKPGTYFFHCDIHPTQMFGVFDVS